LLSSKIIPRNQPDLDLDLSVARGFLARLKPGRRRAGDFRSQQRCWFLPSRLVASRKDFKHFSRRFARAASLCRLSLSLTRRRAPNNGWPCLVMYHDSIRCTRFQGAQHNNCMKRTGGAYPRWTKSRSGVMEESRHGSVPLSELRASMHQGGKARKARVCLKIDGRGSAVYAHVTMTMPVAWHAPGGTAVVAPGNHVGVDMAMGQPDCASTW